MEYRGYIEYKECMDYRVTWLNRFCAYVFVPTFGLNRFGAYCRVTTLL